MFFLLFVSLISGQLFAGNGLNMNVYTQNNGILVMNCSTYDDCYNLLCTPTFPGDYLQTLVPNAWVGDCNKLFKEDGRDVDSEIDAFSGYKLDNWYITSNLSGISILLCTLGQNCNITSIEYYPFGPSACYL